MPDRYGSFREQSAEHVVADVASGVDRCASAEGPTGAHDNDAAKHGSAFYARCAAAAERACRQA